MPWCVDVGFNNNTFKKNRDKDVSFFRIPKDRSLKRRLVQNTKRENLPKDPKICHSHFEESCFKRDLQVSFILIITYYAMVSYHKSTQICNLSAQKSFSNIHVMMMKLLFSF